jgi:hypothetical protein
MNGLFPKTKSAGLYEAQLLSRHWEMIRDVILLVDQRFPDSLVYTESFY